MAAYGILDSVLMDEEAQFASVHNQGILGLLCIVSSCTSYYHSQTDGQVERYNGTLLRQLGCYVAEQHTDWKSHGLFFILREIRMYTRALGKSSLLS